MSGYEIVNVPCLAYGYSIFCCTPLAHMFLVCTPLAWQTFRIRKLGDLGGTCAADCIKTWPCPCCSLIQNEKESNLLVEGRRTGFWGGDGAGAEGAVVQQPSGGLGEEMVMSVSVGVGSAVQEEPVIHQVEDDHPVIVEAVGERVVGFESEAQREDVEETTEAHPHTDEAADQSTSPEPNGPDESPSGQTSDSNTIDGITEQTTVSEEPIPHQATTESITTPQHTDVAPAQETLPCTPSHLDRTRIDSNSDTTRQQIRGNSERVAANHLDCFVPYMRFLK